MSRYYDYVLGLIPAALIGTTAVLNSLGLSLTVAVPVGAGIALGLMAHAMFVKGPVIDPVETVTNPPEGRSSAGGPPTPGASD
ncbi:hypothetical protein [Halorubrum sp. DTA98]|uniref:hypothetical protein n=1 Tax=Halorubrum sp. DTA98 TaxID=3402163 RepID=UPI003AB0E0EF